MISIEKMVIIHLRLHKCCCDIEYEAVYKNNLPFYYFTFGFLLSQMKKDNHNI
jgi:hypothetical protein